MTVYIDNLFFTNLFMDTVLLMVSAFLLRKRLKTIKIIIGSVFLALYGCFIFFKEISFVYSLFFKISMSCAACFFVFGKKSLIKSTAVFWIVSVMCGGIIFAVSVMTSFGATVQMMMSNMTVYFNINLPVQILGCALLYFFAEAYRRICVRSFSKDKCIADVSFVYLGKTYKVKTLVDTGCGLTEPLSGAPLLVVSKRSVQDIVPNGSKIFSKSVGGLAELDLILPERVFCESGKFELCGNTAVALSKNDIGDADLYEAVINPEAICGSENNFDNNIERNELNEKVLF